MLDADELKRRLDGARTLRGLTQSQLAELVARDGLGKHDVGRVERGDLYLSKALRRSICSHLRIPEAWLTEDDLDRVLLPSETERSSIEAKLDAILEHLGVKPDTLTDIVSDFERETDASREDDPPDGVERRRRDRRRATPPRGPQ